MAFAELAGLIFLLALLAGCAPSGPRSLLEGKRLIDRGQYPQAIQTLKAATVLFGGTNALAWNYLGLAYHHTGADMEAEWAYQRALVCNRDFSEVRFNLGCLWLAQNKLEAAKGEFMVYTLRRPDAVEGFLKLGATQLRTRELSAAEKSFNEALRMDPQNPAALNWLGLARLQRGHADEAAQFFESALKQQPSYPPALLNLAIVSHQYLKDRPLALQKYREYLALRPPPANADALAATVRQLEQELSPPAPPAATNAVGHLNPNVTLPKQPATNVARMASAPKPVPGAATVPPANMEVPKLIAEPVPKRAPDVPKASPAALASPAGSLVTTSSVPASAAGPKVAKRDPFQRANPLNLVRATEPTPVRPIPIESPGRSSQGELGKSNTPATELAGASPLATGLKVPPVRYAYKSPPEPSPGNRPDAERSFARGVQAQQAHRLPEAMQAYRLAARQDPSLFEAHYNLGLVATEAGNLPLALASYEDALAVQPASLDARYNFALVLKQANYIVDAVNELERIVTAFPNETRAHLALGNLYAQQLRQPAKARQHYLRVLEVEPRHPQATVIRYWLAEH